MTGVAAAFHQRAETERARLGMTKLALAAEPGVSRVTYDRLATQEKAPLPATIIRLATALGLDRDEALKLAGLIVEPTPAQIAERRVRAAMVEALHHRLPGVDPAVLAAVAFHMGDILQGLAGELSGQVEDSS
ncbi:helix-turn-helix transcriptional regulator [Nonomuraea sp. NPDC049129]|uniref:helix-turn-helix domain-containing protein n=1 Tax=Nonomuraea sp. NPDC049129 TaxID=3155272 RepID=UPI0033D259F3